MDDAIIIFIKNPVAGKVKTRLAATVGNERALEIYLELVAHTLEIVKHIEAAKFIYFSDEIDIAIGFKDVPFYAAAQKGEDLGKRMENAFADTFANLYRRVIIIGTDCPGIDTKGLQSAFNKLTDADVVIGPATDGGYYLLGMREPQPMLFRNIEWSTSMVLQATTAHCINNNISYVMLPELSDIDEEKDLYILKEIRK